MSADAPKSTRTAAAPRRAAPPLTLETQLKFLKGVGPRLGELLAQRGLQTVEDLLYYLPFRYEDRSHLKTIQMLAPGETATVMAEIRLVNRMRTRRGMSLLQATAFDGSGTLHCTWFHADYLKDKLKSGQKVALYGRVERERGALAMRQPEIEWMQEGEADEELQSLKLGRVVPVYEALGMLTSGRIRLMVARALENLPSRLPDVLPARVAAALGLPDRRFAFEQAHFPGGDVSMAHLMERRTPAQIRLIMEELFFLQAGLEIKRRKALRQQGLVLEVNAHIRNRLKQILPFHPTGDQKSALREIVDDLRSGHPMRRLLQGDVGSGKTIVALEAAVIAIENGFQVALMAPTQILAEQHFFSARQSLPQYRLALVTSATRQSRKRSLSPDLAPPLLSAPGLPSSEPQLAIGTQALLEGSFQFSNLGLVIVDEQHRFGVLQRLQLMQKGGLPAHVLVMTATPIPRTLALSLYGDLDVSVIHERPPGRQPITTRVLPENRSSELYEFVRKQLRLGRQAYFVYPLVEESEVLDLKPALKMAAILKSIFQEFEVGLLHGRLSADEKSAIMSRFRENKIQVLVSTTVIEVGMDVPNASTMVIEEAERFGIAQLHQLRGRVGRPRPSRPGDPRNMPQRSYCFLVHGAEVSDLARRRLEALEKTENGFELAELDLRLRGPGEFFGTRQSGMPTLQVADPIRDQELMEVARQQARDFLDQANARENFDLVKHLQARWQRRYGLVEVG